MTSDTRVMNDWKTTSVPQCKHLFEITGLCVCMFTPIYVREHLDSPKERTCIGPADIWGQWKWPPSLPPLGEYSNFDSLCWRVLLPSHLPMLCSWMKKYDLLLTCDFIQQIRQKPSVRYTFGKRQRHNQRLRTYSMYSTCQHFLIPKLQNRYANISQKDI